MGRASFANALDAAHPTAGNASAEAGSEGRQRRSTAAVFADTVSATKEDKEAYNKAMMARYVFIGVLLFFFILVLFDVIPVAEALANTLVPKFRDNKAAGGVGYCFLCALFSIVCVPSSLMALCGGYIFETTAGGFFAAYPGILIGATLSFFAGRVLFKEWIENELRHWLVFASLSKVTQEHGLKVVFFGRLSPIPFGILNYAFSVSAIKFVTFISASSLGLLPIAALYAKAGAEFATYFRNEAVKENVRACTDAQVLCFPEHTYKYDVSAKKALDAAKKFASMKEYEACLANAECAKTVVYSTSCIEMAHEDKVKDLSPLITAKAKTKCDWKTIKEDAEALSCEYNDCKDVPVEKAVGDVSSNATASDCELLSILKAGAASGEGALKDADLDDNARCLAELNEDQESWTIIVLPIALFVTVVLIGFFGYRGLAKSGYLQTVYNLDRQRELLAAEQSVVEQNELVGTSV